MHIVVFLEWSVLWKIHPTCCCCVVNSTQSIGTQLEGRPGIYSAHLINFYNFASDVPVEYTVLIYLAIWQEVHYTLSHALQPCVCVCVLKRLPCQSKPDSSLTCYYLPAFFVVPCVSRQFWVLVNFSNSKVGLMGRTATSETIEHTFCLAGFAIINLEAGLMVRWLWIKDDLEYAGFCTWPGSWNDCFVLL